MSRVNYLYVSLLCLSLSVQAQDALVKISDDSQIQFMQTLSELCGEQYEGVMTYPEDEDHDFANKVLVAKVNDCTSDQVSVPFEVGEDKSRIWIFSKTANGLELKHDHRHADGTPDDITNYGGTSLDAGTDLSQSFPADEFTQQLIPEASSNVWNVTISPDRSELIYHLERHDQPRFTAVLKRRGRE